MEILFMVDSRRCEEVGEIYGRNFKEARGRGGKRTQIKMTTETQRTQRYTEKDLGIEKAKVIEHKMHKKSNSQ